MSTHVPPRRDEEKKAREEQPTAAAAPSATTAPPRAQPPAAAPARVVPPTAGVLPDWAPWVAIAGALLIVGAILAATGFKVAPFLIFSALLSGVVIYIWSRAVEGARKATDRGVTFLVSVAFLVAIAPLISLLYTVVKRGAARFDADFFSISMRGVIGEGGGAYHAILGTLIITGLATLISVPIGVMTAIYLQEYGSGRLRRWTTFLVDVMTGIPSIVAGLFAFALFSLLTGNAGYRAGIGGAVALSLLMIPIVVRSSEEMLKLVPMDLREASYALGVPKWLTVLKVVLPTALAGIVTGIMLAIARVVGETAPLLLVAGFTDSMNYNLFDQRMATLPVYVYTQLTQPGANTQDFFERAWTGALTLILFVLLLNVLARLVARFFAPKLPR
jgi:phosphate transport system permease protein